MVCKKKVFVRTKFNSNSSLLRSLKALCMPSRCMFLNIPQNFQDWGCKFMRKNPQIFFVIVKSHFARKKVTKFWGIRHTFTRKKKVTHLQGKSQEFTRKLTNVWEKVVNLHGKKGGIYKNNVQNLCSQIVLTLFTQIYLHIFFFIFYFAISKNIQAFAHHFCKFRIFFSPKIPPPHQAL